MQSSRNRPALSVEEVGVGGGGVRRRFSSDRRSSMRQSLRRKSATTTAYLQPTIMNGRGGGGGAELIEPASSHISMVSPTTTNAASHVGSRFPFKGNDNDDHSSSLYMIATPLPPLMVPRLWGTKDETPRLKVLTCFFPPLIMHYLRAMNLAYGQFFKASPFQEIRENRAHSECGLCESCAFMNCFFRARTKPR